MTRRSDESGFCLSQAGGEREVQAVLFFELRVALRIIGADTEHANLRAVERLEVVAKVAGLLGAARSVVLRIEIDHVRFASEAGRADDAARLVG